MITLSMNITDNNGNIIKKVYSKGQGLKELNRGHQSASDNTQPQYNVVAAYGSAKIQDTNGEIEDYADKGYFYNSVSIVLERDGVKIGNYILSNIDKDGQYISIEFKDTLLQLQDISVSAVYFHESDTSRDDIWTTITTTLEKNNFRFADKNALKAVYDSKTPLTYNLALIEEGTLWDWLNVLCKTCMVNMFANENGEIDFDTYKNENVANAKQTITVVNKTGQSYYYFSFEGFVGVGKTNIKFAISGVNYTYDINTGYMTYIEYTSTPPSSLAQKKTTFTYAQDIGRKENVITPKNLISTPKYSLLKNNIITNPSVEYNIYTMADSSGMQKEFEKKFNIVNSTSGTNYTSEVYYFNKNSKPVYVYNSAALKGMYNIETLNSYTYSIKNEKTTSIMPVSEAYSILNASIKYVVCKIPLTGVYNAKGMSLSCVCTGRSIGEVTEIKNYSFDPLNTNFDKTYSYTINFMQVESQSELTSKIALSFDKVEVTENGVVVSGANLQVNNFTYYVETTTSNDILYLTLPLYTNDITERLEYILSYPYMTPNRTIKMSSTYTNFDLILSTVSDIESQKEDKIFSPSNPSDYNMDSSSLIVSSNASNLVSEVYNQYKNGKKSISLEIFLDNYYNSNNSLTYNTKGKFIDVKDIVIPYQLKNNQVVPIGKDKNNKPLKYIVTSSEYNYDGDERLNLELLEIVS